MSIPPTRLPVFSNALPMPEKHTVSIPVIHLARAAMRARQQQAVAPALAVAAALTVLLQQALQSCSAKPRNTILSAMKSQGEPAIREVRHGIRHVRPSMPAAYSTVVV